MTGGKPLDDFDNMRMPAEIENESFSPECGLLKITDGWNGRLARLHYGINEIKSLSSAIKKRAHEHPLEGLRAEADQS